MFTFFTSRTNFANSWCQERYNEISNWYCSDGTVAVVAMLLDTDMILNE